MLIQPFFSPPSRYLPQRLVTSQQCSGSKSAWRFFRNASSGAAGDSAGRTSTSLFFTAKINSSIDQNHAPCQIIITNYSSLRLSLAGRYGTLPRGLICLLFVLDSAQGILKKPSLFRLCVQHVQRPLECVASTLTTGGPLYL